MEFIRRFLQHVLPSGFMKIRYYGFMHPSSSITRDEVENKIGFYAFFRIRYPKAGNRIRSGAGSHMSEMRRKAHLLLFDPAVYVWQAG
jgi:hypothetical protein